MTTITEKPTQKDPKRKQIYRISTNKKKLKGIAKLNIPLLVALFFALGFIFIIFPFYLLIESVNIPDGIGTLDQILQFPLNWLAYNGGSIRVGVGLILFSLVFGMVYRRNQLLQQSQYYSRQCPSCGQYGVLKRMQRKFSHRAAKFFST